MCKCQMLVSDVRWMSGLAAVPSAFTFMTSPNICLSLQTAPYPHNLLTCEPSSPHLIGGDVRLFLLMSNNLFSELTIKTLWPFHIPTPVCMSVCVVTLYLCVRERQGLVWILHCCFCMFLSLKFLVSPEGIQHFLKQNCPFFVLCECACLV